MRDRKVLILVTIVLCLGALVSVVCADELYTFDEVKGVIYVDEYAWSVITYQQKEDMMGKWSGVNWPHYKDKGYYYLEVREMHTGKKIGVLMGKGKWKLF